MLITCMFYISVSIFLIISFVYTHAYILIYTYTHTHTSIHCYTYTYIYTHLGGIYIRHFLDADTEFLRSLINPNPIVLFEKMFRRILVHVDSMPEVSILCTQCMSRLYAACPDIIGKIYYIILYTCVYIVYNVYKYSLIHSIMYAPIHVHSILCLTHTYIVYTLLYYIHVLYTTLHLTLIYKLLYTVYR